MDGLPANHPDKVIRKLRKKLRQIDNLNLLERELNEEEVGKVRQKGPIRRQLHTLLRLHHPDDSEAKKRPWRVLPPHESDVKAAKQASTGAGQTTPAAQTPLPHPPQPPDAPLHPPQQPPQEPRPQQQPPPPPVSAASKCAPSTKQLSTQARGTAVPPGHRWTHGSFEVLTLQGHHDLILAVDCNHDYIVSASRDTTVRVWRVGQSQEDRSLRGHTASVTAVSFLPGPLAACVAAKLQEEREEASECQQEGSGSASTMLAVSGSLDCTLRVWNILTGETVGSIYTYNGITCVACGSWGVVTGTEGGRLEFWCLVANQRITFVDVFESQVTAVHVSQNDVYCGSWNGEFGVWQLDPARKLVSAKYMLESESLPGVSLRRVSSLVEHRGKCYLGDEGPNIKVLEWRKSQVSRLKNHSGDVGVTDCVRTHPDGLLLAAAFLVDSGCPAINIRDLESGRYLFSLTDQAEGRFLCLSASTNVVVAGGHFLKVWIHKHTRVPSSSAQEIVVPSYLHNLGTPAVDSGSEEETEWASSSDEEDAAQHSGRGRPTGQEGEGAQWWCCVL